ncbi:hypothetical protein B0H66DRAFT_607628 [Apodospora peruviana]|uniref:Uncharacterized protein n=1 Tax=Apodospora peruviana TaxID=516989 RepID=A0AAE0M0I4_9PEZI|nr:hypothetical protein B0H66DRAFT_607628 [Apodospora peruviana]
MPPTQETINLVNNFMNLGSTIKNYPKTGFVGTMITLPAEKAQAIGKNGITREYIEDTTPQELKFPRMAVSAPKGRNMNMDVTIAIIPYRMEDFPDKDVKERTAKPILSTPQRLIRAKRNKADDTADDYGLFVNNLTSPNNNWATTFFWIGEREKRSGGSGGSRGHGIFGGDNP